MNTRKKSYKSKHLNRKNSEQSFTQQLYQVIPLYIIVGLVPLILYYKAVITNDAGNMFRDGHNVHLDIFSFYKMVFILLFSASGLLVYLFLSKNELLDGQKKSYYIPMGIYSFFILLSALFSEYKQVAFIGYLERYEGVFVLLAYVVIMFLAMNVFREEKFIKILFISLIISAFIISIIGALQYFGVDYYKSRLFMDIVTPTSLRNQIGDITARLPSKTIMTTLSNPNYVGSYMAMLLPITLIFLIDTKKLYHKILFAVTLCFVALNWIGCESRAGIVGGGISILVILFMFRKKIAHHKVVVIAVIFFIGTSILTINFATGGGFIKRIERMISLEGKDPATVNNDAFEKTIRDVIDIKMDHDTTSILTGKGTLKVSILAGKLGVKDENNNEVEFAYDNEIVNINDNRFNRFKLNIKSDAGLIEVYFNDYKLINILFTENGLRSNSNFWMTYRGNKDIETFGFSGIESFGSNRGYIWSRTLPLLKNTIILGHGPDTFPLYFPQYDYMGKLRMYQTGGIFVDKPHNMYLQTAINTGIISLLALLVLFGLYFISSLKIYMKEDFSSFLPIAGLACFSAFCGYVAAGLFNDSVVTVAPVFWVLFGLGIGINSRLLRNNFKKSI